MRVKPSSVLSMIYEHINILGIKFSKYSLAEVIESILSSSRKRNGYICFPSSDIVGRSSYDLKLKDILNNSLFTLVDGKYTELLMRCLGFNVKCISGSDLMGKLLNSELTHYFYGPSKEINDSMIINIYKTYPDAKIIGSKAIPFVGVEEIAYNNEILNDMMEIKQLGPDIIWLGISSPKQDYIMYHFYRHFYTGIMIGVGAVFLYYAGKINPGPKWIKNLGFRWLYRLIQEPMRFNHFLSIDLLRFSKLAIQELLKMKTK